MKSQAIYGGKRDYKRDERVGQDGTVYPGEVGTAFYFYCGDWNGKEIESMGRTRVEYVKQNEVEEYESELAEFGGMVEVSIKETFGDQKDYTCKFTGKVYK